MNHTAFISLVGLAISLPLFAQTNVFPSTGSAGIGDTSPSAALSIGGYTPPVGSIWGSAQTILFGNGSLGDNGSHGQWWQWNVYREGGTLDYRYLDYQDRSNALQLYMSEYGFRFTGAEHTGVVGDLLTMKELFVIRPSGKIGVGTNDPLYPLHVLWDEEGAANTVAMFESRRASGPVYLGLKNRAYSGSTGYGLFADNTGRFGVHQFGVGSRMTFDQSGRVGIGQSPGIGRLRVEEPWGTGGISNIAAFFGSHNEDSSRYNTYIIGHTITAGYGNDVDDAHLWINWHGYLAGHTRFRDFYVGNGKGVSVMMVDGSAGNVGIGTTNPSHKLAVNGTIRAKEVIVDTGWADYVFAEDYELAPLSKVEAHIEEKGHLPDIPSAEEVAENGISVGQIQSLLLAKIEELTLHQIRQEKRLDEQNAEIETLKQKLSESL